MFTLIGQFNTTDKIIKGFFFLLYWTLVPTKPHTQEGLENKGINLT